MHIILSNSFIEGGFNLNRSVLRFLHYVFAACEYGSFHRAAQALGIQASAISRRICDIEAVLGFAIFRRGYDGVELTKQGGAWIAAVRPHYNALHEKTALASSAVRESAILHIGDGTSLGKGEIVKLLHNLNKNKAFMNATLTDGPCTFHRSRILFRQLDVAFVWEYCSHEGCRAETVWRDRLFICLPEGHRLLSRDQLRWADLRNERLLIPEGKNGPLFDPCLLEKVAAIRGGPKIEYCDAAQLTVLTRVMLNGGTTVLGHAAAQSLVPGVAWRPLIGEESAVSVKAIWLESNSKELLQRFLVLARSSQKLSINI